MTVDLRSAEAPLVLAIDVGTSSLRVGLHDRQGQYVEGTRVQVSNMVQTSGDGGVELDPLTMLRTLDQTITQVLQRIGERAAEIVAVGMDTFWHSLMGVDDNANPLTPLYTWADTRADAEADKLRLELDEDEVLQRTGCMLHASYFPAKLRWLRDHEPDYGRVVRWVSFGEFVHLQLFGAATVSYSMASATGLFNRHDLQWDDVLLKVAGIDAQQLSPLSDLAPATGLRSSYARRWQSLAGIPWLPAVGDGAANNVGCGATDPGKLVLMIGTSGALRLISDQPGVQLPRGLWNYYVDGKRTVYGGALSEGGSVYSWLTSTLKLNPTETEAALATMQPDAHGLTVLPFLAGERSPGYHAEARGVILGLSLNSSGLDILRASLEAIAYRFATVYQLLCQITPGQPTIIASGGALRHSPVWGQMIADVIGRPMQVSGVVEATERGSAILALEAAGQPTLTTPASTRSYEPDMDNHTTYQQAIARQQRMYDLLVKLPGE